MTTFEPIFVRHSTSRFSGLVLSSIPERGSTFSWIDSAPEKASAPGAGPFSGAELIYPAPEKAPAPGQAPVLGQDRKNVDRLIYPPKRG